MTYGETQEVAKGARRSTWMKEYTHISPSSRARIKESTYPQSQFWSTVLNMQLDYLIFLRSTGTGDFNLYTVSLERILPWVFAFDYIHYSRWLPVHYQDMETLRENSNVICKEFVNNGNFVIHRTRNPLSDMRIDQRHEQLNKDVKSNVQRLTRPHYSLHRRLRNIWLIYGMHISPNVFIFVFVTIVTIDVFILVEDL